MAAGEKKNGETEKGGGMERGRGEGEIMKKLHKSINDGANHPLSSSNSAPCMSQ